MPIAVSDIEGLREVDAERYEARPAEIVANPMNPRREVGDVSDLARSMSRGQIQPIAVVTRDVWLRHCPEHREHVGEAAYVALAGSRRLAAAQQAGLKFVDIVVKNALAEDRERLTEAALIENVERTDLARSEVAATVAQLIDVLGTQTAVAKRMGYSQNWISQMQAVSRLAPSMQARVDTGEVTLKQAAKLAKHDVEDQPDVFEQLRQPPPPRAADGYSSAITHDQSAQHPDGYSSAIEPNSGAVTEPASDSATNVDQTVGSVVEPETEVYSSAIDQRDAASAGPNRPQPYRPKKPADTAGNQSHPSAVDSLVDTLEQLPAGDDTVSTVATAVRRGLSEDDVAALAKRLTEESSDQ